MAYSQAQADVEQATGAHLSDDAGRPPMTDGQPHPSGSLKETTADKVIVLSFLSLQWKRIGALQDQLIAASLEREPHPDRVDQYLNAYAQALRNYETLTLNAIPTIPIGACFVGRMGSAGEERRIPGSKRFGERAAKLALKILPSLEEYSGTLGFLGYKDEAKFLEDTLESLSKQFSKTDGPSLPVNELQARCGELGFRELGRQERVRRAEKQALAQRTFMGMFGGISLICPVVVMVLYPSQNTNLITVSVATIIFASLLANYATDGTGKDVLGATAAYTAVLVVFLGTSEGST